MEQRIDFESGFENGRNTFRLSLIAEAQAETQMTHRDAQIATYFGRPTTWITALRSRNPVYWDHLERRWMTETFGPLAPMHLLAAQARTDRATLRDQRRAARRLAVCCPPLAAPEAAAPLSGWSCAALAIMDWLCRHSEMQSKLIGWGTGLLAAYLVLTQLCPGLLAEVINFWKG